MSLRERQRQATHEAIQEATLELALERPLEQVTVQEICLVAEVSQRTFFNHFRNKDEALIGPLPVFSEAEVEQFVGAAEPDLLVALEQLLVTRLPGGGAGIPDVEGLVLRLRVVADNPQLMPRLLAVFEDFEGQVRGLIALRTGRAPGDLFCRVAASVAISMARAVIGDWRETAEPDGAPDAGQLRSAFAAARELLSPAPARIEEER